MPSLQALPEQLVEHQQVQPLKEDRIKTDMDHGKLNFSDTYRELTTKNPNKEGCGGFR